MSLVPELKDQKEDVEVDETHNRTALELDAERTGGGVIIVAARRTTTTRRPVRSRCNHRSFTDHGDPAAAHVDLFDATRTMPSPALPLRRWTLCNERPVRPCSPTRTARPLR